MSNIAEKFNEIVTEALSEIDTIDQFLSHAEAESAKYPKSTAGLVVDAQFLANRAQAEATLAQARAVRAKSDVALSGYDERLASLRGQYCEQLHEKYDSRSKDIDSNLMTLLQSGTMSTADYVRAADDMLARDNFTMLRIVGKSAKDAAEAIDGSTPQGQNKRMELMAVAAKCNTDYIGSQLEIFDGLCEIYRTCKRNRHMSGSWNELSGRMLNLL